MPEITEIYNLDSKVLEIFPGECVNKDLSKSGILSSRALPSFVSDWLISKFADGDVLDTQSLQKFLNTYLPDKSKADAIKLKLTHEKTTVKILSKFSVEPDIKTGEEILDIPILDLKGREGFVSPSLASENLELLNGGMWGIGELKWNEGTKKGSGRIELISFKPFKPYKADLEYYRKAREHFGQISEWIDFLIKAMEYDPESFTGNSQKIKMISRLLPFVEPRVNLIELAPKGTGKSYVFGRISKYGWLISGGSVSRAQLFYDINRKKRGIITRFDYIALDEIQTIKFTDPEEVIGALKGYLEAGEYKIGAFHGEADAGFIILGNIPLTSTNKPRNTIYSKSLPKFMRESAFLDRFHGFIEGWELPRIKEGSLVKGYSINSEFFSEILHELRKDMIPGSIVSKVLSIPQESDKRDINAVKRIATGYLKLLFPNVRSVEDLDVELFRTYCLNPAIEMRGIIRKQLSLIDDEFSDEMPNVTLISNSKI